MVAPAATLWPPPTPPTALAEREAAKDRAKLMNDQGDDVNHSDERIVEIRRTTAH